MQVSELEAPLKHTLLVPLHPLTPSGVTLHSPKVCGTLEPTPPLSNCHLLDM
jgi:hypothetical protein